VDSGSSVWNGGAIPLPGVSLVMDIGLDETSLKRYAELTKTDYQHLKSIVASSLGGFEIRAIVDTCVRSADLMAAAAAEEVSRYIPLIGSLIAAPLSAVGIYITLKLILTNMERVALEVAECAAESAASACSDESDDDDDEP